MMRNLRRTDVLRRVYPDARYTAAVKVLCFVINH